MSPLNGKCISRIRSTAAEADIEHISRAPTTTALGGANSPNVKKIKANQPPAQTAGLSVSHRIAAHVSVLLFC